MEYRFEELQPLMFVVYDVDNETPDLEDDDFLGQIEVNLGGVVSIGSVTQKLQHKNTSGEGTGDLGTITVSVRIYQYIAQHLCTCTCIVVHVYYKVAIFILESR